jgi:hypothetical protein
MLDMLKNHTSGFGGGLHGRKGNIKKTILGKYSTLINTFFWQCIYFTLSNTLMELL